MNLSMKLRNLFWLICILFLSVGALRVEGQEKRNPFIVDWNDAVRQLSPGEKFELRFSFQVPAGHYLYQDKTLIDFTQLQGVKLLKKNIPPSTKHLDPFTHKEELVYLKDFEIVFNFEVPRNVAFGRLTLEGELRYQGCSSDFCFRPMKLPVLIPLEITAQKKTEVRDKNIESQPISNLAQSQPSLKEQKQTSPENFEKTANLKFISFPGIQGAQLEKLTQLNPFLLLLLAFVAGVLTAFTPCVLPVIPLTLAVIGLQKQKNVGKNLLLTFSLILGMALTYALLGLASAFLGLKVGFIFQSFYFLIFLILFFGMMSLALFDVIRLELPLFVRSFLGGVGGKGYLGSFLAGMTLGFIASPCVGPLVGPLLLWVAQSQNVLWGGVVLLSYGLGMGLLFLVGGTFYSSLGSRLKGGYFTLILKRILALLMLLPALYYGSIIYSQVYGKKENLGWAKSLSEGFTASSQTHKPIVLDFYADWCLPCLEIDHKTFHNPEVQEKLKKFIVIKIDCTQETEICKEAVDRYQVIGWPTLLFFDRNQQLQKDLSVIGGFVGPEKMLEILNEIERRSL